MPKTLKRPNDKTNNIILCNIEDALKRQNISKQQLRQVLGVSSPTLNKYYTNPMYFTLGQLMTIARLGKVDVSDLLKVNQRR